jgi:hypothetical protein
MVMRPGVSLNTVFSTAVANSTQHIHDGNQFSRWHFLLGGLLGTALLSVMVQAHPVQGAEVTPEPESTEVANQIRPIEDGVYFYGSAPQPDEIGHAYMVFEAQNSNLLGAIFMPQSSFDCFSGHIRGNELALQITNSYSQEIYGYAIALVAPEDPIASVGTPEVPLQLDGFTDLGTAREADLALLETCRAALTSPNMAQ